MVLSGSRSCSLLFSLVVVVEGSQCSRMFSIDLSGSRRFSVVLVGSQCSRRFSMVLSGSRRFSMFLRASCWFS